MTNALINFRGTIHHRVAEEKNKKNINKEAPSTSSISSTSTQSTLTDLYGKAAYATILLRETMLNRNLSLNSSMSTSAASTPKSEEVKEVKKEEAMEVLKLEERSLVIDSA